MSNIYIEEKRIAEQIKELVHTRDRCSYSTGGLSKEDDHD